MDFVPEIIDDTVILNAVDICNLKSDCRSCSELTVGVHNWLIAHEIPYLVVDFQDEKEVCTTVLTELLQLNKRLDCPFVFCGLMEKGQEFLKSYLYSDHPVFDVPEDAAVYLKKINPSLAMVDLTSVKTGEAIPCTRSRVYRSDEQDLSEVEEDLGESSPEASVN